MPAAIWNGEVYFLFGKEGKFEDSAPGFSDFGGGTDPHESFLRTAVREAGEELTGFLGPSTHVRQLLRHTYSIDHQSPGYDVYRVHIFPFAYNPWLPFYYNHNQRFLQQHLPSKVFRSTKIFEKAEIRWIASRDLRKLRPTFRCYFRHIVDQLIDQASSIRAFLQRHPPHPHGPPPVTHRRRRRGRGRRTRKA